MNNTINCIARGQTFFSCPKMLNLSFSTQNLASTIIGCIKKIFASIEQLFSCFSSGSSLAGKQIAEKFNKKNVKPEMSSYYYENAHKEQFKIDVERDLSVFVIHKNELKMFNKKLTHSIETTYEQFEHHIHSICPDETKKTRILKRSTQRAFNSTIDTLSIEGFEKIAQEIRPLYKRRNDITPLASLADNPDQPLDYFLSQSSMHKTQRIITHRISEDGSIKNSGSFFVDLRAEKSGDMVPIFSFQVSFSCDLVAEKYDYITCKLVKSHL